MSTIIDRAALIEQSAKAAWAEAPVSEHATYEEALSGFKGWMLQEVAEDEEPRARVLLPIIAKAMLAPLRELHQPVLGTFTPWGGKTRNVRLCRCRGGVAAQACPTLDLLDAIEAEVQP